MVSLEIEILYRVEDVGSVEHGQLVAFDRANAPPMGAIARFQLACGRMVWLHFVGKKA